MAYSDKDLADFLRQLDKSADVSVSDWTASFIASNLDRKSFSPKQRQVIENLIDQYAEKLKW